MPVIKPLDEQAFLKQHLPASAVPGIHQLLVNYKVHLHVTRARSGKLGDYCHNRNGVKHTISINHNLHPYQFLITVLHELAHMMVKEKYKKRLKPHGNEWNKEFVELSIPYLNADVFPEDVKKAFTLHLQKGYASTSVDVDLMTVLRNYEGKAFARTIQQLSEGAVFEYNGRVFKKGSLIRKRYKCLCLDNNRDYLFSPLAEIKDAV